MAQQENYPDLRAPKINSLASTPQSSLSANAPVFVPKWQCVVPQDEEGFQSQMTMPQSSQVHQRFAMAQGGGDGSGGGGGGYDYTQMPHHLAATNNGPMMANGSDPGKLSALQNRLSNMQILDSGDNGKEFNHHHQQQPQQQQHHHHHHHHNQQSMHHQHHQQHRGQQHPGGHHGYYHHQQQQQHHQQYVQEVNFPNNHHVQQGGGGAGMGGDHRKYNNGGQQHQQQYQHHRSRQQHHHHHQQQHQQPHQQRQQHQQQQQQYGGNHHHDYMDGGGGPAGYNNMVAPNWESNFQEDHDQPTHRQMEVMDYLTEVIAELLDNPGMFDSVQKQLPIKLRDLRQDHYVLSSTIEMIFEQSIRESNFRYMGARLCQLLDSLAGGETNSVLRELLRLKMEDQNLELPRFMTQEQVKVRGATLFLAELYMQLRNPQQTFGKTISEYIINAITILLMKEGPENIKCVCQCLKLCGYELEQDRPDKVETILKNLQTPKAVQSSTEAMIRSVLELRKNSWGRSEEIATASPSPGPEYKHHPVFYGPDGKMLTEEESSFLATNIESAGEQNAYGNYDDEDEFGMVDPDDDPEVQEAYEAFLQSNAQTRLQQPAVRYRPDA
uniref:MIF4G domain-containing protein n=1 Tax=Anopheles funestus TaxID=62324 RepID=A0A4Y0BEH1_ANOFN